MSEVLAQITVEASATVTPASQVAEQPAKADEQQEEA